jgi:hypothetical protein
MGTSFSWGADVEPMPSRGGGCARPGPPADVGQVGGGGWTYQSGREPPQEVAFLQRSTAQIAAEAGLNAAPSYGASPNAMATRGFGDTGSSSVRLHAPAGGANAMGSSFGWGEENMAPATPSRPKDAYAEHMLAQAGAGVSQSASSQQFAVGSQVIYTQIGKAKLESLAVIVGIEPAATRKDNYRIQFEDGRERNTSEDRLVPVR